MALRCCEQALALIELFKSISVLGKWPKTGLSKIVFASGCVYTGTTLSKLFQGHVGFGEDLSSIDHDGLT
jgi:hypothetical protein